MEAQVVDLCTDLNVLRACRRLMLRLLRSRVEDFLDMPVGPIARPRGVILHVYRVGTSAISSV